jgi:hypothetical protein
MIDLIGYQYLKSPLLDFGRNAPAKFRLSVVY